MPRRLVAVPLAVLMVLLAAWPAAAADFAVTTTADGTGACPPISGLECTLRQAVTQANNADEASTITLPAGTYTLNGTALPTITRTVTVVGTGANTTTISGNGLSRVFSIAGEQWLFLRDLTVANGSALGDQTPYGGNILVGNTALLGLVNVRVTGGRAANGGGIGLLQGRAVIASSLIDNNTASDGIGGGIAAQATSTGPNGTVLQLTDSTAAFNNGAGIASAGFGNNTTTLERATVAYNRLGGGLFAAETQANFTLKSSIVAGNAPVNCGAIKPVDRGQNVESLSDCAFAAGSQFANPGLAPAPALSPGGQTPVLELLAGSPAIDRAVDCGTGTADQRGVARPQLAACDAGAFEYVPPLPPVVTPTPQPTPTPTATPSPAPVPVVNRTVVVREESGTILVRRPGSSRYAPLDATLGIPVGSTVDARRGVVVLTSIPKAGGKPETAKFWDGIFKVTQSRGITTLTLTEPLAPCSARARAAQKKPKTRKLWGDGKGKFRTKGRYSAATVRGTKWLVTDGCRFTRTRVTQGAVTVTDGGRTIILRKGRTYTARPGR